MNFSTFCKNFYIRPNTIKNIDSQNKFIGTLFNVCGSTFFSKNIKRGDPQYWISRSLYSGKRRLTVEMKESFPDVINEKEFIAYFKGRINETALKEIVKEFAMDEYDIAIEPFLNALCRQFEAIIQDETELDVVAENYKQLLKNYEEQNKLENHRKNKTNKNVIKSPVSRWLPDAEFATEEQSDFESFTLTESICSFMNPESGVWGIRSAKGAGKTYSLQKMRRDMNDYAIPHYHKLSIDNEWGTESVRFDNPLLLEKSSIVQLAGLWKVSILCLVINCIDNPLKRGEIKEALLKKKLSENIINILDIDDPYYRLNDIINSILLDKNWRLTILNSYTELRKICKKLISKRIENEEDPIVIFIDKVDQSVLQPGAEVPECNTCYKDTKYDLCEKKDRDPNFCFEECRGCCFGCEKFVSSYAGEELRIYGTKYGKRYEHISQWQYLQLSLVVAVDNIRLDFNSKIQIYYAIRQEAFNAEENLLGANAPKIINHTKVLHYTKNEQEKIFNNTIKIQHPDYLYNPDLIKTGEYAKAFVGISRLCHPHVLGEQETLFECIYRHSFDRAREIQYIGEALAKDIRRLKEMETQTEREEHVKKVIESTAADLVFLTSGTFTSGNRTYYSDKQILLRNYWANPNNFKNFIQEIDRNLLFMDDLAVICKKVNKCSDCDKKCRESNCEHHPFSMLYHIGLLGRISYNVNINTESEQVFIDSKDITYYRDEPEIFPNDETLFILHPALTKCIEKNIRGTSIMHFRGFILGKGLMVSREIHKKLLEDKRNMSEENFMAMYYSIPN